MAAQALAFEVRRVLSAAVDADFYRTVYLDLVNAGADPLDHYLDVGWREGRDPAPWFCTRRYLEDNPDVAAAGCNPLHHYLTRGRREGREAHGSKHAELYFAKVGNDRGWRFLDPVAAAEPDPELMAAAAAEAEKDARLAAERATMAEAFDAAFYLAHSPDVTALGEDPLDHFVHHGWREGRDPAPWFSVADYLDAYPDIAEAGINPFAHYLRAGRTEGRAPKIELGFRYEILKALTPVDVRVAVVADAEAQLALQPTATLARALAKSRTGLRDLHLTFSHDDFTANSGGVQLCLQREAAQAAALGRDHLHFHPARPWPVVRTAGDLGSLGIVLNGERLGDFAPAAAVAALAEAAKPQGGRRSFAIHSLLGHSAEETAAIVEAAGMSQGLFWLHDFASLCAGFHLLRNDVEDCAAPPPQSAACGVCVYGPWRVRHLLEHRRLFERLQLTVASPSELTLAFWRSRTDLPAAGMTVLPHAVLRERGVAPGASGERPLRIAFAGMPVAHKGWPIFADLVRAHAEDPRYRFLHLGGATPGGLSLEHHRVVVTEARPRAMQEAIEGLEVDVVLVWPLCRETFSFTAYEAVAGGAAVVTWPDSGNVAAFVAETGFGRVLPDEAALAHALAAGELSGLKRGLRQARLYDLDFSRLSFDLQETGA